MLAANPNEVEIINLKNDLKDLITLTKGLNLCFYPLFSFLIHSLKNEIQIIKTTNIQLSESDQNELSFTFFFKLNC